MYRYFASTFFLISSFPSRYEFFYISMHASTINCKDVWILLYEDFFFQYAPYMLLLLHLLLLIRFLCYSCLFIQYRSFLHYFPFATSSFSMSRTFFTPCFHIPFIFPVRQLQNFSCIIFLQNHFAKIASFIFFCWILVFVVSSTGSIEKKEKVKFTRETSGEDRFFRIIASLGNYHGLSIAM